MGASTHCHGFEGIGGGCSDGVGRMGGGGVVVVTEEVAMTVVGA